MSTNNQQKFFKISSNSMYPALRIGDVVILGQKMPEEIKVGDKNGDILILRGPQYFYNKGIDGMMFKYISSDTPIIHRAIEKKKINENWFFKTKGDNNWFPDGSIMIKEKTNEYIFGEYNFTRTIYIPDSEVLGVVIKVIPSRSKIIHSRNHYNSEIDINMFDKMEIKAYLKK